MSNDNTVKTISGTNASVLNLRPISSVVMAGQPCNPSAMHRAPPGPISLPKAGMMSADSNGKHTYSMIHRYCCICARINYGEKNITYCNSFAQNPQNGISVSKSLGNSYFRILRLVSHKLLHGVRQRSR